LNSNNLVAESLKSFYFKTELKKGLITCGWSPE